MNRQTRLIGLAVLSFTAIAATVLIRQGDVDTDPVLSTEGDNGKFPTESEERTWKQAGPVLASEVEDDSNEISALAVSGENNGENSWPPDIEGRIWEFFAHQGKSNILNINSVECTETNCTIEITGAEVNSRYVGEFGELHDAMLMEDWNVQQSNMGTREIAPNVRVYSIRLSNVPIDQEEFRRAREASRRRQSEVED